jgi:hypothetical protein
LRIRDTDGGFEVVWCEVGILQCHRDVGVAEDLTNSIQVCACHDKTAGAGMAQVVVVEILNLCFLQKTFPALGEVTSPCARLVAREDVEVVYQSYLGKSSRCIQSCLGEWDNSALA